MVYYLGSDVKNNVRSLLTLARKNGLPNQTAALSRRLELVAQDKPFRDFYILGGGSSILDLGSDQHKLISRSLSLSLGMGFLFLSALRPDIWYLEGVGEPEGRELWRTYLRNNPDRFSDTIMAVPSDHFLKYHTDEDVALLKQSFPNNLYWIRLLNIQGTSEVVLKGIVLSVRVRLFGNYLSHFRGSLSVALQLAARLKGIRRVILLGVDLTSRRNFWNSPGVQYTGYYGDPSSYHSTAFRQRDGDNLSIVDYVRIFNRLVLRPQRKELLIGSERSLLADFLPVWRT